MSPNKNGKNGKSPLRYEAPSFRTKSYFQPKVLQKEKSKRQNINTREQNPKNPDKKQNKKEEQQQERQQEQERTLQTK